MTQFDLFEFYRASLITLVLVYTLLKLGLFIWRWNATWPGRLMETPLIGRYIVVMLLRLRLSRFAPDLILITALLAFLFLLVRLHP